MPVVPVRPVRRRLLARTATALSIAALAASLLGTLAGAGTSGGATASARAARSPRASSPFAPAPSELTGLATTLETSAGTWAVVPMGRLGQPLDTFWQLLFRATSSARFSDVVSGLGVATNGGIVLAPGPGTGILAGVRSAARLTFSPVAASLTAGRSWQPVAPLPESLADSPGALVALSNGTDLALVGSGSHLEVLATTRDASTWHQIATMRSLGASPAGRHCRASELTTLGAWGAIPVVGAECAVRGVVGILALDGSRLDAPSLPVRLRYSSVSVLRLAGAGPGLAALLELSSGHASSLVLAESAAPASRWRLSVPAAMARGAWIVSDGPTGSGGLFALAESPTGKETLYVIEGPRASWQRIRALPDGTRTVAIDASGSVEALSTDRSTFTSWLLRHPGGSWQRAQTLEVAIQLGSSP